MSQNRIQVVHISDIAVADQAIAALDLLDDQQSGGGRGKGGGVYETLQVQSTACSHHGRRLEHHSGKASNEAKAKSEIAQRTGDTQTD